jgi:hypothetical protein
VAESIVFVFLLPVVLGVVYAFTRALPNPDAAIRVRMAAMDVAAQRFAETCPICSGSKDLLCPICLDPITEHTHENDYLCDCEARIKFVNPVRRSDGQRISGDGTPGPLRYIQ